MEQVGRPSLLTDELTLQIRKRFLAGIKIGDICSELNITAGTWDSWVYNNIQGFRDNMTSWKKERLIRKAEKLSEEILDLQYQDEDGKANSKLLSIKQKEAEFIRETLAKTEGYTKRSELTGANGEALLGNEIVFVNFEKENEIKEDDKEQTSC